MYICTSIERNFAVKSSFKLFILQINTMFFLELNTLEQNLAEPQSYDDGIILNCAPNYILLS